MTDLPLIVTERYELLERLGVGAFSEVWRAKEIKLDREVALKIIPRPSPAPSEPIAEAKIIAGFNHPHIVQLYGTGTDRTLSGQHFVWMAMQLIDGDSLESWGGPLVRSRALEILHQIASALEHAHKNGIVHRDLKPANVLVEERDGVVNAWLTDFGVATVTGTAPPTAGTPCYMAPEQIRGEPVDERTDIFALGTIAISILTGELAFPPGLPVSKKPVDVDLEAILDEHKPGTGLDVVAELAGRDVAAVLRTWLAKNPQGRQQSMTEVLADLDDLTANRAAGNPYIGPRRDVVREVVQKLKASPYGVALLTPWGFEAQDVVDRVVEGFNDSDKLMVNLFPDPYTDDEATFYGKLGRDLRHGLERATGLRPLPPTWRQPFDKLFDAPSKETFEDTLENFLEGPVEKENKILVLVVDGLVDLSPQHLQGWAFIIRRLKDQPLRVFAWGGLGLHRLCWGFQDQIEKASPFQQLEKVYLPALSEDDVSLLLSEKHPRALISKEILHRLTGGHPALVTDLLDRAGGELAQGDGNGLSKRAKQSPFLAALKSRVKMNDEATAALQSLVKDGMKRRPGIGDERLRWLGIVVEGEAEQWRWTAPLLADWARA
jgi:serine/threonine protein kinase